MKRNKFDPKKYLNKARVQSPAQVNGVSKCWSWNPEINEYTCKSYEARKMSPSGKVKAHFDSLEQAKASVPNQLGKATRMPTMRWIFQLFEGVHLLIRKTREETEEIILNMNPVRAHVLAILGPRFEKIYANS